MPPSQCSASTPWSLWVPPCSGSLTETHNPPRTSLAPRSEHPTPTRSTGAVNEQRLTNPSEDVRSRASPHGCDLHERRGTESQGHRPDRHDDGNRLEGSADCGEAHDSTLRVRFAVRTRA